MKQLQAEDDAQYSRQDRIISIILPMAVAVIAGIAIVIAALEALAEIVVVLVLADVIAVVAVVGILVGVAAAVVIASSAAMPLPAP